MKFSKQELAAKAVTLFIQDPKLESVIASEDGNLFLLENKPFAERHAVNRGVSLFIINRPIKLKEENGTSKKNKRTRKGSSKAS